MPGRVCRSSLPILVGLICAPLARAGVDYLQEVKPILRDHCYACHGAFKQESDLRLDTGESVRSGGGSGPAAVPGMSMEV